MASKAMPIILAGKAEPVAEKAIQGMKPEVEVVHFIFINDARREIPILSRGEIPNPRNPHGTGDWSTPPKAIVFTAIYKDSDIDMLRKLTMEKGGEKVKHLPWLRVDRSIPTPPVGPEMVAALSERSKEALKKLEEEGKLTMGAGVDYYY